MNLLENQSNHHFTYIIEVSNTQEKVWSYLTNVERWKEWDTEITSASLLSNFVVGAKGTLIPKKGPKLKFHISEIIEGKSYIFKTKMPVGYLEIKRILEKKGELIMFTDDIQFTGFLKGFFGFVLGRGFKSVIPEVMRNFKNIVEKE